MRRLKRWLKWSVLSLLLVLLLLLSPVAYVETFCRSDVDQAAYQPFIKDADWQRREANSYLTYPEWHIVYAYEGLAKVLETDDEHAFGYFRSVSGFWKSFCALNRTANRHGGGDFNTRSTVHTIGVSFTFEMALKALYEETVGRLFAALRGDTKTPQDLYSAKMAADYAGFLQQVPWYKYDFDKANEELWQQSIEQTLRGWERRLALGGEWKAKSGYAGVIAQAVAATAEAPLRIRSVVNGLTQAQLSQIEAVDVLEESSDGVLIETPRYRKFTHILEAIAATGGSIVEIAGNDDIMLSAIEPLDGAGTALPVGSLISRIARDGFESNRILVSVKLAELPKLLSFIKTSGRTLEHIYDY